MVTAIDCVFRWLVDWAHYRAAVRERPRGNPIACTPRL